MKQLLLAILAYLLIGVGLGWGLLLAANGNWWLLIVGVIGYIVAFGKFGCLPTKSH